MRRKDREQDLNFCLNLADRAAYGVLSVCDGEKPYSVPLSLVRVGGCFYFHSALSGKKRDLIGKGAPVHLCFVGDNRVPEPIRLTEEEERTTGRWVSRIFTTSFESVMVSGNCTPVYDEGEKIAALKALCLKYTPDRMKYFDRAIEFSLNRTAVYRIDIENMTGKAKK